MILGIKHARDMIETFRAYILKAVYNTSIWVSNEYVDKTSKEYCIMMWLT